MIKGLGPCTFIETNGYANQMFIITAKSVNLLVSTTVHV